MKKTINGLLLAMAVCAIPSYGKWDYEDDRQLRTVFKETLHDLGWDSKTKKMTKDGVASTVHTARELVEAADGSKKALDTLVQLLKGQGIDVSSKSPSDIIKTTQDQIKNIDQKIKSATT